ncbi:S-adenosyl-L-methionine-dependent methyltransferase [Rhizodiscina lignyota]|uniref:S-adenosyl-L-methionine-dependent methyltransferase n=1 Tax=Rhizodiscina lignyota TaxID=1504668 RepID=A0A9P4M6W4_9PEZI|nr:S-adenosyl-L-methionine-dependent methyltransferase [Rhizodiscina lignyota]
MAGVGPEQQPTGRDSAVHLPPDEGDDVPSPPKSPSNAPEVPAVPTSNPIETLSFNANPDVAAQHDSDNEDAFPSGDSAYDSESLLGDDTMTLASFITEYRTENGRQYHAYRDGAYWGPNDEPANETQDLAHHMYLLTLDGKLHLAPIENNPHRILDVGTGTGIWAIDMADQYPSAAVVGTDLSAIQPDFVPPNCSFEVDDVTLEWTYPEDHFDFIHIREMFGSIPDWDYFFQQCFRCVRPGGWVEIVEHSVQPTADDETVPEDHFYRLWGRTVIEMGGRFGKTFNIWQESREKMEQAGFVEVTEIRYKWPMNGWSSDAKMREIGRWNQLRLHEGVEGMMLRLLTVAGGWSFQRAQLFLHEMRKNLKDYDTHAYLEGTVVYGRRPWQS